MEFRTCEEYVLSELDSYKNNYEKAREDIRVLSEQVRNFENVLGYVRGLIKLESVNDAGDCMVGLDIWEKYDSEAYHNLVGIFGLEHIEQAIKGDKSVDTDEVKE